MVNYVGLRLEKVFATGVQCETYSCKSLTLAHRKYSLGFGHKLLNLAEQLQMWLQVWLQRWSQMGIEYFATNN